MTVCHDLTPAQPLDEISAEKVMCYKRNYVTFGERFFHIFYIMEIAYRG